MANVHDAPHDWDEREGNFDENSNDQTRSEAGSAPPSAGDDYNIPKDLHEQALEVLTGPGMRSIRPLQGESHRKRFLRCENMYHAVRDHVVEPKRALFGEFWMERELVYLVSVTGSGKSLYGNQIAIAISEGRGFGEFRCEPGPLPVGLVDFENTLDDHTERMGSYCEQRGYENQNYWRLLMDETASSEEMATNVDSFVQDLADWSKEKKLKALIIDNVTWLQSPIADRDKQQATGILFQALKRLTVDHGLAVMVIGHTLKSKEFTTFTLGDVAGSSKIGYFCERVVAIGNSLTDSKLRYVKTLKTRGKAGEFSSPNHVAAFRLGEMDGLVHLMREKHLDGPERSFLREQEEPNETERAKLYLNENPETTVKDLAEKFGIDKGLASKIKNGKR